MCKVYTSSHEITNPYMVIYEFKLRKYDQTVTADWTTNYDAKTNTSLPEKINKVSKDSATWVVMLNIQA